MNKYLQVLILLFIIFATIMLSVTWMKLNDVEKQAQDNYWKTKHVLSEVCDAKYNNSEMISKCKHPELYPSENGFFADLLE